MAESLRILMTADAVGGVWTYALGLASRLQEAGHRVLVALMGPAPTNDQRSEADRAGVELRIGSYRLEWQDEPWRDVERAGQWLLELERELDADLVHLNGFVHAALAFRAPVLVVAHSCVATWWQAVHGTPLPTRYARYVDAVRTGLASAACVVAPSRAMLDALRDRYGVVTPAKVIPNGLWATDDKGHRRERFVLGAGRLDDEAKNVQCLVRAAALVALPVVLAGTPPEPAPTGVVWLGRIPRNEVLAWTRRASIFAAPARYEPFGLGVLEAALAGCALVLGDIPSLRELWGGAAVFVPPDDAEALAAALTRLADDDTLRAIYARRAADRARRYSTRRMTASYIETYRGLVRGHSRSDTARVDHALS